MTADHPDLQPGLSFDIARVFYPAGDYVHPPTGLVQLRLVRRGSSYADLDLGMGSRRVFTRPGDLLLSLPDRPTAFRIDDGRELTLLQVSPPYATALLHQCGGRGLDDLSPLLHRPVRESLIAEIMRRLEAVDEAAPSAHWAIGVIFANLLRLAQKLTATAPKRRLLDDDLARLMSRVRASLDEAWPVQRLADEVGFPRRTFSAAFKMATGVPVHQHVLRLRSELAAELLRTTDLPIAAVAARAGFASQAHLTRVLNRLMRTTPGRIRSGS